MTGATNATERSTGAQDTRVTGLCWHALDNGQPPGYEGISMMRHRVKAFGTPGFVGFWVFVACFAASARFLLGHGQNLQKRHFFALMLYKCSHFRIWENCPTVEVGFHQSPALVKCLKLADDRTEASHSCHPGRQSPRRCRCGIEGLNSRNPCHPL